MRYLAPTLVIELVAVLVTGQLSAQVVTTAVTRSTQVEVIHLAPDVSVRRLSPHVWLHATTGIFRGDTVVANGLIIVNDTAAALIDTGWNPEHASQLLDWAQDSLHRPVRLAVITHSHRDRAGGLAALRRAHIRTVAFPETIARLAATERTGVEALRLLPTGVVTVPGFELYYPGPGHAIDNIVVFVPADQVLFGGCLVKDQAALDLGNLQDADLSRWPLAVRAVLARYGAASVVVPGHGPPGGLDLLRHTEALLEQHQRAPGGD